MKTPKHLFKQTPLQPGDIIDVIAPASGCSKKQLQEAFDFIESWGFTPRAPKDIFGKDYMCANTDSQRLKHFKTAVQAKDSQALWCLRGGWGSQKFIPQLSRLKTPTKPKLVLGFSDITSLHLFCNLKWGWPSIHCRNLKGWSQNKASGKERAELKKILTGQRHDQTFTLKPMNSKASRRGAVSGVVMGGNLRTLTSQLSMPWGVTAQNRILVLEEVGERGYQIDHMLFQLNQSGFLKGVKGIVFGEFTGGEESNGNYAWKTVKKHFAKEVSCPVWEGLPVGHGPKNHPLVMGLKGQIKTSLKRSKLTIQWSPAKSGSQ